MIGRASGCSEPASARAAHCNTGVAIETADIALMKDDLLKLPQAVDLTRRTVNVMRQNIAIALITVLVLLAGVFAGGVAMAIGTLVHEASVLLVILNAMRLMRRYKDRPSAGPSASCASSGSREPRIAPRRAGRPRRRRWVA